MPMLLSTLQADVLTLTLNRPERANSFNVELISELQEAFSQAEKDSQVRVIILTGSNTMFINHGDCFNESNRNDIS